MSSVECLCSEEPLQELAWGCSAGAVRQVYGKLPGGLLQQQQLEQASIVKAASQASQAGAGCPRGRAGWLGRLPRLRGGSWPKRQGGRNVLPSLAASPIRLLSGDTSTVLLIRARPPHAVIPNGVVD